MGAGCGSARLPFCVSAWVGVPGSWGYFADVSKIGQYITRCSAFYSLCRSSFWCVSLEYSSISRFEGVFSVVWGFCVGLCWLRALRGLWGFCVREWLGGLKACGVFASLFLLSSLCLPLFYPSLSCFLSLCPCVCSSFLLLLSFVCPLVLLFLFPLRTIRKKERAQFFCVLSCPVVCCVSLVPCALLLAL